MRTGGRLGTALIAILMVTALRGERINHAGRILGPAPVVVQPVHFHTPEADAIVSALQIFPVDSAWNEDVSRRPLLANSDAMIARITSELASGRRTLRAFYEMNYVLVPDDQPLVPIDFFNYGDESDPSPYPIPANLPVETWPRETGTLTLDEWQRDVNEEGGDRHAIIVQPGSGGVWETWLTRRVGSAWEASNGARFNLRSNALRPDGWTSGDAAGLSMFAGLVRYDECARGTVEHALRIIVRHTRRAYLYPATHHASVPSTTDPNVPAMGQRLRLKAAFVIPDHWSIYEKAVLNALKRYGALVADNGNFLSISVAPDPRFPSDAFDHFASVSVSDFEVVQGTGPTEGPRAPGAPSVDAGPDRTVALGVPATLAGSLNAPGAVPVRWRRYAGPGLATFEDVGRTNTPVTFSASGDYTLLLEADDGVHAVAYDAVVITVAGAPRLRVELVGGDLRVSWEGGAAPYRLERTARLGPADWTTVVETSETSVQLTLDAAAGFYRVIGS